MTLTEREAVFTVRERDLASGLVRNRPGNRSLPPGHNLHVAIKYTAAKVV